jgi:hypothetical protein
MLFLPGASASRLLGLLRCLASRLLGLLLWLELLLPSESGFADFGLEASRLNTSNAAGFIVVGNIAAHPDRTHHFPFFKYQDTTSDRRNATS